MKSLRDQGILAERDFRTYQKLFVSLVRAIRPPTLLVYLRADLPTLRARIGGRARGYEQEIPGAYLARLEQRYAEWLSG